MGKYWKSCELGKIGHCEPLWWGKIRKVVNWAKLAILSHSEPLRWEKIGKVVTWTKLNFSGGGGVHQPEAQCHVDPKFQLNLKNRCFLSSVFHKQGSHRAYGTAVHVEV